MTTEVSSVFSDWSVQNLHLIDWESTSIRLTICVRSPDVIIERDASYTYVPAWASIDDLDDLLTSPGWQEVSGNHANTGVSVIPGVAPQIDASGNVYVGGSLGFTYISDGPIFARAFILSIDGGPNDGKIIVVFAPDEPIYIVGFDEDNTTRIKPPMLLPSGTDPAGGFLFGFPPTGGEAVIGPIGVAVPSLRWESARSAHVWMQPNRINYVVNSSFESIAEGSRPFGWRSNSSMSVIDGGINHPPRVRCVMVTGSEPAKIIQSVEFPTVLAKEWWSVEAAVAGHGRARIGLIFFGNDASESFVMYTPWKDLRSFHTGPDIDQGEFSFIKGLIPAMEHTIVGVVSIEFEGTDPSNPFYVDNVIVDPSESQFGYFDGDWIYGQVGDYGWYNGQGAQDVNSPHRTYSVFYNNRKSLTSYLFDYTEGKPPQHHAQSWVPEGASVIPHFDDVFGINRHSWQDDVYIPTLDVSDPSEIIVPDTIS